MGHNVRFISAGERKIELSERRYCDFDEEDWIEKQLDILWRQLANSIEPGEILKKAAKLLKERKTDEH